MASDENMSRANLVTGVNANVNITGTAANVANVAPAVQDNTVSTGNKSSAPLPTLVLPAQAMVVMMEHMRQLQAHMVSIASAIGNSADVSGARAFLRDFANDAGRMQARLAGMIMHDVIVAPVAHVVADNAPVVPVAHVVANDTPAPRPVPVAAVSAPIEALVDTVPPRIVSSGYAPVAASIVTPPVMVASVIPAVPAHVLPPAAIAVPANANPSPVALTHAVTPSIDKTDSAAFAHHS